MDLQNKTPLIILIGLILISITVAGGGFYLLQKERVRNVQLEENLEEITTKNKIMESKYLEAQKLLTSMEENLKAANSKIESLTNELAQEKGAKEEALGKIEQIKMDLQQQRNMRVNLEGDLLEAQDEVKKTKSELNDLRIKKEEIENKLKEFEGRTKGGVELGKIVVTPEPSAKKKPVKPVKEVSKPKGIEGKVLVVNKDYNFAVINLGSKDRINLGDQFSVYRNNELIGGLKVEKLHDSMSAAGFLSEDIKNKIKEGDQVILNKK